MKVLKIMRNVQKIGHEVRRALWGYYNSSIIIFGIAERTSLSNYRDSLWSFRRCNYH